MWERNIVDNFYALSLGNKARWRNKAPAPKQGFLVPRFLLSINHHIHHVLSKQKNPPKKF